MPRINGDIRPISSGIGHLGINAGDATSFDISTLSPFGHIHLLSGVFHNEVGTSGIFRFGATSMEVSNDGGITFTPIATGSAGVSSVGVIGGANLTGDIDLASVGSGFISITDTAGASPILIGVDTLGLSGLWGFPTQGFNGRVVNSLTDFNGTEVQGTASLVGASGIVVDIVGQTITVTPGNALPKCYTNTYSSSTTWTIQHNLGSLFPLVMVFDDGSPKYRIDPDDIEVTDSNTVTVRWNQAQAGSASVIVC